MTEVFEAKLRRVGNSLGVIIPNGIIQEHGFDHGDTIHVAIPSTNLETRNKKLLAMIGSIQKRVAFKRDKGDRF